MKNVSKQGNGNAASQLRRVLLVGTALTGVVVASDAMAVENWVGGTGPTTNSWFTGANWSAGGVPPVAGETANIIVASPSFQPSINSGAAVAGTINLDNTNTLTVTGVGTTLTSTAGATGTINVGQTVGGSTFQVLAGGAASFTGQVNVGTVASPPSGLSKVIVDGAGSTLTFATNSTVGLNAAGLMIVSNGATINATTPAANLNIGNGNVGSIGQLIIGNGGTAGASPLGGNITTVTVGNTSSNITFNQTDTTTITASITGTGSVTQSGSGTTILTANNNYSGVTTISAGTLQIANGGATGTLGSGNVVDNATLTFARGAAAPVTVANNISGTGAINVNSGTVIFTTGTNTYSGTTTINSGATLQISNAGTTGNFGTGNIIDNGTLIFNRSNALNINSANNIISGTGNVSDIGTGSLTFSTNNTYSGTTTIAGGSSLQIGAGGTVGAIGTGAITANGTLIFNRSDAVTLASTQTIAGAGVLNQNGPGALTLAAANTFTGTTNVNGGTLVVPGTLPSTAINVNTGGTLTGVGTIGSLVPVATTTINSGGTFTPGTAGSPATSMTVNGNLVIAGGANYNVTVNPTATSHATVNGTATLSPSGTANVSILGGAYAPNSTFNILTATSPIVGPGLTLNNLNPNYNATLAVLGNNEVLTIVAAQLGNGSGLGTNQSNVANSINTFANVAPLPAQFTPLFNLTGQPLATALSTLTGEVATGAQRAAFGLQSGFLGVMLDPYVDGRGANTVCVANNDDRVIGKAPRMSCREERLSIWSAVYGGANRTNGSTVAGTTAVNTTTFGGAVGLDYKIGAGSAIGVSLGGGGTNWKLSNQLGKGESDAFQAGVYGIARMNSAYLAAAFAYSNHWMTTDRNAFGGENLKSKFDAQSYGGRVEGGWAFARSDTTTVTPYAAWQGEWLHTPDYSETSALLPASSFGLNLAAHTTSTSRVETGLRYSFAMGGDQAGTATFRGKIAYAHDWYNDPALTASFQALSIPPGTAFLVNGAKPASDLVLISGGPEIRYANGITVAGKLEGELGKVSQSYVGKAYLRYAW